MNELLFSYIPAHPTPASHSCTHACGLPFCSPCFRFLTGFLFVSLVCMFLLFRPFCLPSLLVRLPHRNAHQAAKSHQRHVRKGLPLCLFALLFRTFFLGPHEDNELTDEKEEGSVSETTQERDCKYIMNAYIHTHDLFCRIGFAL